MIGILPGECFLWLHANLVLCQCSQTVPTYLPEQLHHHLLTEMVFGLMIAKDPFMLVSILTRQHKL